MNNCIWDGEKMCHIWIYAGNPDYFPYEGMKCDCGEIKWHNNEKNEKNN